MKRAELLQSIASTVADYRQDDIEPMNAAHVDKWVTQFDVTVQIPLLTEIDHVMKRAYVPRSKFDSFVEDVLTSTEIGGAEPCTYWRGANFLTGQLRGNSQRDLLTLFGSALRENCGMRLSDCGSQDGPLIYLDDAVYGGMHLLNDVTAAIPSAPQNSTLFVIVIGLHTAGAEYAAQRVKAQLISRRGGAADARLLAVLCDVGGRRMFREPTAGDLRATTNAAVALNDGRFARIRGSLVQPISRASRPW